MEWVILSLIIFGSFGYGIAVGNYKIPPYNLFDWLVGHLPKSLHPYYLIGDGGSSIKIDNNVLSDLNDRTDLEIHFIGKKKYHPGNCICVSTDNNTIVMDTGREKATESIINYLSELNVNKIDLLIISHYHGDHIGGVGEFKERFEIQDVALPKYTKNEVRETYIKTLFDSYDIINANDEKEIGDVSIEFYGPAREFQRDNNNSIVCKLEVMGVNLLLTGDAEKESEEYILNSSVDLDADILQVGHHGRNTSTTPEFLSAIDPEYAIIFSDGCLPNSHPDVISRLGRLTNTSVYDTSAHGSIIVQVSDGDIDFHASVV